MSLGARSYCWPMKYLDTDVEDFLVKVSHFLPRWGDDGRTALDCVTRTAALIEE